MLSDNFINIESFLLFDKTFRYTQIISIYPIIKPKRHKIAKNIQNDLYFTIEKNVLLKSTPCIYKKPCTTSPDLL